MSIVTVVGNPRAASRTHQVAAEAARHVAAAVPAPPAHIPDVDAVDLTAVAGRLLATGPCAEVEVALDAVAGARILLVATPTYKGTYTGLLKAFLDRLPPAALAGAVALPIMVMGDPRHAMAVEVHLRPLLIELGAAVPTPGLALLESDLPRLGEVLEPWVARIAPQVAALLGEGAAL